MSVELKMAWINLWLQHVYMSSPTEWTEPGKWEVEDLEAQHVRLLWFTMTIYSMCLCASDKPKHFGTGGSSERGAPLWSQSNTDKLAGAHWSSGSSVLKPHASIAIERNIMCLSSAELLTLSAISTQHYISAFLTLCPRLTAVYHTPTCLPN